MGGRAGRLRRSDRKGRNSRLLRWRRVRVVRNAVYFSFLRALRAFGGGRFHSMKLKITYYLDVPSSWCFLAEPAWAALKERYNGRVDFDWKIALMDAAGVPASREQLGWFYRRSGTIMRSPFMLNTGWLQPGAAEYPVRNFVAEAARDLGVTDDRVRLALATAVLRDGKAADKWEVAAEIGAQAGGLEHGKLLEHARAPAVEARVRASTADFHELKVTQRPT